MDLVEIARVGRLLERHPTRGRDRLFSERERAHCVVARSPMESYAARFAAKEAVLKALGTGWTAGARWRDVEVVADDAGAPHLVLHGALRELADRRGVRRTHVTLTHTGELAAACVVLESGPE